jgi:hypothetical protein
MADNFQTWIDRLTVELGTFDDDSHNLLSDQSLAFDTYAVLIREEQPMEEPKHCVQYRYERRRARRFLVDVYSQMGSGAFVLCALAIPITDLSHIKPKERFPQYRKWWRSVPHPAGLSRIADQLCKDLPFTQDHSGKKRSLGETAQGTNIGIKHLGQTTDSHR